MDAAKKDAADEDAAKEDAADEDAAKKDAADEALDGMNPGIVRVSYSTQWSRAANR